MARVYYSYFREEDLEEIIKKIEKTGEYSCIIAEFNKESELMISRIILSFLSFLKQDKQYQTISFIANKLISNSSKANEKNGDSTDKKNYIKININIENNHLIISIINSRILSVETKRDIDTSIKYANKFNSLGDIIKDDNEVLKPSVSGLILIVLMLKKIGISSDALQFYGEEDTTKTVLDINFKKILKSQSNDLTSEIIKAIDVLPQFPDSLLRLQKELKDPEWNYNRITDYVLSDPSLTGEVIRLVNSPIYGIPEKIDNVSIAIKKIGVTGLQAILYNHGVNKIVESRYDIEKINLYKEHLFQVALISSYLANDNNLHYLSEDVYIAALMHDIGKIVVNALNVELSDKIENICSKRSIPSVIIDNITEGYNHSVIGAKLTEKWNFPKKYIAAIKYHHRPCEAPEEFKTLIYLVYIGNEISHVMNKTRKYSSINIDILKYFGLESTESFNMFVEKIKNEGLYLYK